MLTLFTETGMVSSSFFIQRISSSERASTSPKKVKSCGVAEGF
jgi:hypothetical protein